MKGRPPKILYLLGTLKYPLLFLEALPSILPCPCAHPLLFTIFFSQARSLVHILAN